MSKLRGATIASLAALLALMLILALLTTVYNRGLDAGIKEGHGACPDDAPYSLYWGRVSWECMTADDLLRASPGLDEMRRKEK